MNVVRIFSFLIIFSISFLVLFGAGFVLKQSTVYDETNLVYASRIVESLKQEGANDVHRIEHYELPMSWAACLNEKLVGKPTVDNLMPWTQSVGSYSVACHLMGDLVALKK